MNIFTVNRITAAVAGCFALCGVAVAQTAVPSLSAVTVESSRNSVLGEAGTANEGVVTQK